MVELARGGIERASNQDIINISYVVLSKLPPQLLKDSGINGAMAVQAHTASALLKTMRLSKRYYLSVLLLYTVVQLAHRNRLLHTTFAPMHLWLQAHAGDRFASTQAAFEKHNVTCEMMVHLEPEYADQAMVGSRMQQICVCTVIILWQELDMLELEDIKAAFMGHLKRTYCETCFITQ